MRTIAAIGLLLLAPLTAFAQAKPGGKIMYAARQDIDTLDPHITNRAATRKILIQFTDTLTVINPKDGKVLPGLAESWEVARDGKSYTFKLRKNVKFHDGTPFDAAAVKFTFDRIQEPLGAPGVARAFLGPYDGADVVDAHTVRVRLKQPYAPFLRMVGLSPLAPLSPTAVQKMGQDFSRKPVGTGPFMVKEWVPKSHVTLVRNPDYAWPPGDGDPSGPRASRRDHVAVRARGDHAHRGADDGRGAHRRGPVVRRRRRARAQSRRAAPARRPRRHALDDLPERPALSRPTIRRCGARCTTRSARTRSCAWSSTARVRPPAR